MRCIFLLNNRLKLISTCSWRGKKSRLQPCVCHRCWSFWRNLLAPSSRLEMLCHFQFPMRRRVRWTKDLIEFFFFLCVFLVVIIVVGLDQIFFREPTTSVPLIVITHEEIERKSTKKKATPVNMDHLIHQSNLITHQCQRCPTFLFSSQIISIHHRVLILLFYLIKIFRALCLLPLHLLSLHLIFLLEINDEALDIAQVTNVRIRDVM